MISDYLTDRKLPTRDGGVTPVKIKDLSSRCTSLKRKEKITQSPSPIFCSCTYFKLQRMFL